MAQIRTRLRLGKDIRVTDPERYATIELTIDDDESGEMRNEITEKFNEFVEAVAEIMKKTPEPNGADVS